MALQVGSSWVEGVPEVKAEVKNYLEGLFLEVEYNRLVLDGVSFSNISAEDNAFLTAPFSRDEIKDTVWSCDGDKSPGPYGFNLLFYMKFWHLLKFEVCDFIQEFYTNASFPKAITATFLALIPKKDHPQSLSEYRPISSIGSMYKIVAKLVANRLKSVLGKVISSSQSAFLPGRQILDRVVVVNELLDLAKKRKDQCLLPKVDFEKAYDSVS